MGQPSYPEQQQIIAVQQTEVEIPGFFKMATDQEPWAVLILIVIAVIVGFSTNFGGMTTQAKKMVKKIKG